jgi:thioredoxin reductase (NADPH)
VKFNSEAQMDWEPSQPSTSPVPEKKEMEAGADHGYEYDLFVIGGGSGGISSARAAGNLGKKVAVADFVKPSPAGTKWGLGGTCVNVGCIPKKLMHTAGLLNELREDQKDAGIPISDEGHNWKTMQTTVGKHIKTLNWGYKTELIKAEVKYFNMYATLYDKHTIYLDDGKKQQTVTADKIVIACGGRPTYPDIPGAKEFGISSDDIFWKKEAPGKTLVVGASYVALECAGFLNSCGYDVTVMVRSILLRGFDQDMANLIGKHMEENGTKMIRGAVPSKLEKPDGGKIKVSFTQDGEEKSEEYDTVLFAIGRTACTEGLKLENVGIVAEKNGKIMVNEREETTVDNIFAIGDVIYGNLELTPVAIKAGKLLCARIFGGSNELMDYINVPTTVFTPLEYGCCGLSEVEAIEKYGDANIDVFHQ